MFRSSIHLRSNSPKHSQPDPLGSPGKRDKEIGLVSRTPLANHPDYARMRQEMDRGSREERSDANLRARTEMNLYEALRLVQRDQVKG